MIIDSTKRASENTAQGTTTPWCHYRILDVNFRVNWCSKDNKLRTIYLLIWLVVKELDAAVAGCKLLSCWLATARLLVPPPPGISCFEGAGVPVPATDWPVWPSTGFLERWRPLLMCRSQYFWSGTASLRHRHFFPSVLRHLPGSGSVLLAYPNWIEPHPTAQFTPPQMNKFRKQ